MKETILRQATKFENIKEIIYNSVKMYPNHVAFVTKKIKEKGIEYKNTTYKKMLDIINKLLHLSYDGLF